MIETTMPRDAEKEKPDNSEAISMLEQSAEPGAAVLARILRRAAVVREETVMWGQNWNAHNRST